MRNQDVFDLEVSVNYILCVEEMNSPGDLACNNSGVKIANKVSF